MALQDVVYQIPRVDTILNVVFTVQYVYNVFKKVLTFLKNFQFLRIFCPIEIPPEPADYDTLPITIDSAESESVVKKLDRMVTYNALVVSSNRCVVEGVLECRICLEQFGEDALVVPLSCDHIFHATCFYRYLMNDISTCPLCKSRVRY